MELDEFEFKPLTEGLGFQRAAEAKTAKSAATSIAMSGAKEKVVKTEMAVAMTTAPSRASSLSLETESDFGGIETQRPMSKSISDLIASLPPSLDFTEDKPAPSISKTPPKADVDLNMPLPDGARPQIFQPFAREDFKAGTSGPTVGSALAAPLMGAASTSLSAPGQPFASPAVNAAMKAPLASVSSPYRERLDESFARAFPHAERRAETRESHEAAKRLKPDTDVGPLEAVPSHFGAGFLDAMIVTGISTIFLVMIILITRINLWGLLTNAQTDRPTQVHIALLFLSVLQMYMLAARSFFGASLGEWAFDMQLGTLEDQKKTVYPLQVAWRTILMTFTGLVPLPILSLIFGRDLARSLTGLQLYRRI